MKTFFLACALTLIFTGAHASNPLTTTPQSPLDGPIINPNCVPNAPGCPWNWPPVVTPQPLS